MRTLTVGNINWNADFALGYSRSDFLSYGAANWDTGRYTATVLGNAWDAMMAYYAEPSLSADGSATVDNPINITFTDNVAWREAVTEIRIGSDTIHPTAWTITAGVITLIPANDVLLQTSGTVMLAVYARGYEPNVVSQAIAAGVATHLLIHTQPAAPSANGGALATQPVIYIADQYDNTTTSTANVVAAKGAGTWTIGGTVNEAASAGVATYTDLTATSAGAVSGATITFTSGVLPMVTSGPFNIPA